LPIFLNPLLPLSRISDNSSHELRVNEIHLYMYLFFLVVMTMGFTQREARLGLRASAGNIDQAVQHIMQRKEVRGITLV